MLMSRVGGGGCVVNGLRMGSAAFVLLAAAGLAAGEDRPGRAEVRAPESIFALIADIPNCGRDTVSRQPITFSGEIGRLPFGFFKKHL